MPVSLVVTGANVNDVLVLAQLLDGCVVEVPEPVREAGVHLCIDGAYDNRTGRAVAQERGLQVHVQPKPGSEQARVPEGQPRHPARRWVVEVTHAWLNRWRRVQTRWEKRVGHYTAFVQLAICMLIWRKIRLKSPVLSG